MNINTVSYTKNTNQINRVRNTVNFTGVPVSKLSSVPGQVLDLSEGQNLNKKVLDRLKKTFKEYAPDSILQLFKSCQNSNGIVHENAFYTLQRITGKDKSLLHQFFTHKQNTNLQRFGIDFFTYLLEGSKDIEHNHNDRNLEFLTDIVENYTSNKPVNYLHFILQAKNDDGIITDKIISIYNQFKKTANLEGFLQYATQLKQLPQTHRDLILCSDPQKRKYLYKILQFNFGEAVKEFLTQISSDISVLPIGTIEYCLYESMGKDNIVYFENYKKLVSYASNKTLQNLLTISSDLKNNDGLIIDDNAQFANKLFGITENSQIVIKYLNTAKDNNGIVNKEVTDKLLGILKESNHPDSCDDIIYCINKLKNKNGEIQWDYVNIFAYLKRIIDKSHTAKQDETFSKILKLVKDKDDNIIQEITATLPAMLKENLLTEIPDILQLSFVDNKFDKNTLEYIVKIISQTYNTEKLDLLKFLQNNKNKNGNLDKDIFQVLQKIKEKGIETNIISIIKSLKNPDGKYSDTGLDFIEELQKQSTHHIEKELPDILDLCRGNDGLLNKKSMETVKELQTFKTTIPLSKLLKLTLDDYKNVNDKKLTVLKNILKDFNSIDIETINKIITYSSDKYSNIDIEVLKCLTNLAKKGHDPDAYKDIMPVYRAFYRYERVTSLSQLNLEQKRNLMKNIRKYKDELNDSRFRHICNPPILPTNDSEYCSLLAKLSHRIGIKVTKLPETVQNNYYKAMENLADPNSTFMHIDFDTQTPVLNLDYPLEQFKQDIWNMVQKEHYSDRTKAMDYFGFELKNKDGALKLVGYPRSYGTDGTIAQIKDKDVAKLVTKIYPYIIKFTENNKVSLPGHPSLSKDLTDIVTAFPEFLTTIGKKQHGTQDFTLDIHCLKVLQEMFKNPEYNNLSSTSKKHAQFIALLHDITKAEGEVDHSHPDNSAFDVYYLLDKFALKEKDKLKIYQVIRKHGWLKDYDFKDTTAQRLAFNMRNQDAFKLLTMLTASDLKGVQKHNQFYIKHGQKLKDAKDKIEHYVKELQATEINLPQTKIPRADKVNLHSPYVKIINKDGIKNTVIYLHKGMDLSNIGFESCKDINDLNVLVHGLDSQNSSSMFQALGTISSHALLSASYVLYSKGNYKAFRNEGFILNVPATNIHVAYWRDFGSGYKKDVNTLLSTYLFCNHPCRNYISDQLKKELHLNSHEYKELFREFEDLPIEKLDKHNPKIANAYRKVFSEMDISRRSGGRNYNEILVTCPKIQGIFTSGKNPEDISIYLRKYAAKHNIPILVFN